MGTAVIAAVCVAYFAVAIAGAICVKCLLACSPKWMMISNAVSGGILIGFALVHMLAENAEEMTSWGQAISKALGGHEDEPFPIGFALAGAGFFLIIALGKLLGGHTHKHEERNAEAAAANADADAETAEAPHTPLGGANVLPETHGEGQQNQPTTSAGTASSTAVAEPENQALKGMATLVSVSIHSFIESVAAGTAEGQSFFGMLVLATLFHKGFAAFAVASALEGFGGGRQPLWWCLNIIFALTGPVGVIAGAVFKAEVGVETAAALQCLASGTLLAVGIDHMLLPALEDHSVWKKRKLFASILAFLAVSLLAIWA